MILNFFGGAGGSGTLKCDVLTSSRSWTAPDYFNNTPITIIFTGGGGSGAATHATGYSGGGGSGGIRQIDTTLNAGQTIQFTCGAGGAAVEAPSTDTTKGNDGGTSTVRVGGRSYTCTGGKGGPLKEFNSGSYIGGAGGSPDGNTGETGSPYGSAYSGYGGGTGAKSIFGGSGGKSVNDGGTSGAGEAGKCYIFYAAQED